MSTAAVSSSSLNQQLQYFQTRQNDLKELGQALGSGDLASAQTAYSDIVALGQNGPFAGGNPFKINQREQDFTAIGQALQSGDLAGAQQAFAALKSDGRNSQRGGSRTIAPPSPSPASSSGPEIVLNLSSGSSSASPEQIIINIGDSANGGDQISLSLGNQGSSGQVTFNLSPNSNEQIVVNLLDGSSSSNTLQARRPRAEGSASRPKSARRPVQ
jgi:hypothetical protein